MLVAKAVCSSCPVMPNWATVPPSVSYMGNSVLCVVPVVRCDLCGV